MKKIMKKTLTALISLALIFCVVFTAYAVVYPDINAVTTRIGTLDTPDANTEGTQGLSVTASGSNNRLFVVQTNEAEDKSILYMYKDYTSMSNSADDEYGYFILSGFVGHANGMAIDDKYIYITCWDDGNDYGNRNKIARISRSMLWSKYKNEDDVKKGTLTANSDGVTIIPAVYSDGKGYNKKITAITYYKDGKFIINYRGNVNYPDIVLNDDTSAHFCYTTAEIIEDKLVVNNSESDIFFVSFDVKNTTPQDIGYDPDCGFFIVRYLGGANNAIIWVKLNSLTGENRVYQKDNSKYRVINVNKSSDIFSAYELESVSIGSDNHMYANVNTTVTDKERYPNYVKDAIIRIRRPEAVNGSRKFLGGNITL